MTETRDKILDAARELFYEHGYYATSTRVIARDAGVNEVTLFRHFGNKEELLKAIIQVDYGEIDTFKDFIFPEEESQNIREDLTLMLQTLHDQVSKNRKIISIIWDLNMSKFDHHFLPLPRKGDELFLSYFRRMEKKGLIRSMDYSALVELIKSTMLGRLQLTQRFGKGVLKQADSDFIRAEVDMIVCYLDKDRE